MKDWISFIYAMYSCLMYSDRKLIIFDWEIQDEKLI